MPLRSFPLQPPPDVPSITIDTTPEEWAAAHHTLTGHDATVIPWGALCECGAVWTRDPEKGGEMRRNPGGAR